LLSNEEREQEKARRARAGSAQIPKSHPDETIVAMESFFDTLFLFSQHNIFRVRMADDVDPDVTEANVPWVVNAYLSIGTTHELIAASFGTLKEFTRVGFVRAAHKEKMLSLLMEFAVCAAEMEFARHTYQTEVKVMMDDEHAGYSIAGSAAQIPRISSFEVCFSIFFSSAKRAVGKLMAILEWAAGFPIKNGTHIDKFCNRLKASKKHKKFHELVSRIEPFTNGVALLNELRNAFEHPTSQRNVLLQNIALTPKGQLMMPTFTLNHDQNILPPGVDFGTHVEAVVSMISKLAETVMLVAMVMKDDGILPWQARVKTAAEVNPNYPTRWKVELGHPDR